MASTCPRCAREACDDPLHGAPTRFVSADDLASEPPPTAIVDGVLWARGVTILVGESGAGKTFVTLDLAAAVAAGAWWHGRPTTAGSVAYLSFEGDALGQRLRALRAAGRPTAGLYLLRAAAP